MGHFEMGAALLGTTKSVFVLDANFKNNPSRCEILATSIEDMAGLVGQKEFYPAEKCLFMFARDCNGNFILCSVGMVTQFDNYDTPEPGVLWVLKVAGESPISRNGFVFQQLLLKGNDADLIEFLDSEGLKKGTTSALWKTPLVAIEDFVVEDHQVLDVRTARIMGRTLEAAKKEEVRYVFGDLPHRYLTNLEVLVREQCRPTAGQGRGIQLERRRKFNERNLSYEDYSDGLDKQHLEDAIVVLDMLLAPHNALGMLLRGNGHLIQGRQMLIDHSYQNFKGGNGAHGSEAVGLASKNVETGNVLAKILIKNDKGFDLQFRRDTVLFPGIIFEAFGKGMMGLQVDIIDQKQRFPRDMKVSGSAWHSFSLCGLVYFTGVLGGSICYFIIKEKGDVDVAGWSIWETQRSQVMKMVDKFCYDNRLELIEEIEVIQIARGVPIVYQGRVGTGGVGRTYLLLGCPILREPKLASELFADCSCNTGNDFRLPGFTKYILDGDYHQPWSGIVFDFIGTVEQVLDDELVTGLWTLKKKLRSVGGFTMMTMMGTGYEDGVDFNEQNEDHGEIVVSSDMKSLDCLEATAPFLLAEVDVPVRAGPLRRQLQVFDAEIFSRALWSLNVDAKATNLLLGKARKNMDATMGKTMKKMRVD